MMEATGRGCRDQTSVWRPFSRVKGWVMFWLTAVHLAGVHRQDDAAPFCLPVDLGIEREDPRTIRWDITSSRSTVAKESLPQTWRQARPFESEKENCAQQWGIDPPVACSLLNSKVNLMHRDAGLGAFRFFFIPSTRRRLSVCYSVELRTIQLSVDDVRAP